MKHLKEKGMGYFQHMFFALSTSFQLFLASVALTIHAFLPCLFENTGSEIVKAVHKKVTHGVNKEL